MSSPAIDYTPLGIVNEALGHCEVASISTLDDRKKTAAREARARYGQVLLATLADAWQFARTRASLPATVDGPVFGGQKRFKLPSDCVLVTEVDGYDREDWEVEDGHVVMFADAPLNIFYTRHETNPVKFSPLFRKLFALELADALAPVLARDRALSEKVMRMLKEVRRKARRINSVEARRTHEPRSDWLDARRVP